MAMEQNEKYCCRRENKLKSEVLLALIGSSGNHRRRGVKSRGPL